jgi:hypothetical protein
MSSMVTLNVGDVVDAPRLSVTVNVTLMFRIPAS